MDNGFRVTAAQLRDHATAVGALATHTAAAADAGRQVAGMDNAYGLICWPIERMLAGPQDRCADALEQAAKALSRIANDLDSAAETYERIDSTAATHLRQISNRLSRWHQ
ncbi:MAG: type VII secretion target [Pseudonocardiaceae bacterium]